MNNRALPDFTSFLSKRELIAVLAYLPVHICLLPLLFNSMVAQGVLSETESNFCWYAIGAVLMVLLCFRLLRRDFDPLCDRPVFCLLEIFTGYFTMMCLNFCVAFVIALVMPDMQNQNNADVMDLVLKDYGMMKASTVFLAPVLEEILFRGGLFGGLYDRNRKLAYIVSILAFSLYHVWGYAMADPAYWFYILEYIPVAYLLARCYERTNSIWCSIFFHMINNGIALRTLDALMEML